VVNLDVVEEGESPEAVEAARGDAATALERALDFVEGNGDALARLRTQTLLGAADKDELVTALAERQLESGGFERLGVADGGGFGLDGLCGGAIEDALLGTLEALMILGDVDALHAAPVERAAVYVEQVQSPSGAWGPDGLPENDRLILTGLVAGLLGRTRVVRPAVLAKVSEYMTPLWTPDRVENANWKAIVGFGTYYSHVGDDLSDEALQWVGRELERGYRSRRIDAAETLRALMHCDAAAIPGASLTPFELLRQLLGEQSADGGFAQLAPAPPAGRVSPSIDAMGAILKICRIL